MRHVYWVGYDRRNTPVFLSLSFCEFSRVVHRVYVQNGRKYAFCTVFEMKLGPYVRSAVFIHKHRAQNWNRLNALCLRVHSYRADAICRHATLAMLAISLFMRVCDASHRLWALYKRTGWRHSLWSCHVDDWQRRLRLSHKHNKTTTQNICNVIESSVAELVASTFGQSNVEHRDVVCKLLRLSPIPS